MKKAIYILIVGAAVALAVASCARSESVQPVENGVIGLDVAVEQTRAGYTPADLPTTMSFALNTVVVDDSDPENVVTVDQSIYSDKKVTFNVDNGKWSFDSQYVWPRLSEGMTCTVVAVAPFFNYMSATTIGPHADQSTADDVKRADYLFAKHEGLNFDAQTPADRWTTDKKLKIELKHLMSKLKFNLTYQGSLSNYGQGVVLTVSLPTYEASYNGDLFAYQFTKKAEETTTYTTLPGTFADSKQPFEVIVIPTANALPATPATQATIKLTIHFDDQTILSFTKTLDAAEYLSGKAYTYNLTVSANQLFVDNDVQLTDWETGEAIGDITGSF